MLPYIFLTYDKHLPSRQLYVASMVFMVVLATLSENIASAKLRAGLLRAFCLWNVFYMWTTKDRQFLERAAPTTELLQRAADAFAISYPCCRICLPGTRYRQGCLSAGSRLDSRHDRCQRALRRMSDIKWDERAKTYREVP